MIENNCGKIVLEKLNSYGFLQKNIDYIDKKIKMVDQELLKVKVSSFEENRGGINNYRVEKLLDEKIKLIDKLNRFKFEKNSILELVDLLDKLEKEIIVYFYFKKYSIDKISSIKNYSYRYISKVKQNGLEKLSLYIN